MVLDPFSAIGLASSIVQFVAFGSKLLSTATEIHQSIEGALPINKELEIVAKDLNNVIAKLDNAKLCHKQAVTAEEGVLTEEEKLILGEKLTSEERPTDEEPLIILADSCKQVAWELLSVLEGLKGQYGHKRWKSLRQALRSAWREKGDSRLCG